jgi:hypothetical protein
MEGQRGAGGGLLDERNEAARSLQRAGDPMADRPYGPVLRSTRHRVDGGGFGTAQRGHGEMSKPKSSRKRIEQKIWRLTAIASRFGLKVESMDHLAGFTAGELEAYYWNLDWLVKERIMAVHPEVGDQFDLPDHLEAWEWLERLG